MTFKSIVVKSLVIGALSFAVWSAVTTSASAHDCWGYGGVQAYRPAYGVGFGSYGYSSNRISTYYGGYGVPRGGSYHDTSHYDWHDTSHWDRHGNHYHYHRSGHWDFHPQGHWHGR